MFRSRARDGLELASVEAVLNAPLRRVLEARGVAPFIGGCARVAGRHPRRRRHTFGEELSSEPAATAPLITATATIAMPMPMPTLRVCRPMPEPMPYDARKERFRISDSKLQTCPALILIISYTVAVSLGFRLSFRV